MTGLQAKKTKQKGWAGDHVRVGCIERSPASRSRGGIASMALLRFGQASPGILSPVWSVRRRTRKRRKVAARRRMGLETKPREEGLRELGVLSQVKGRQRSQPASNI